MTCRRRVPRPPAGDPGSAKPAAGHIQGINLRPAVAGSLLLLNTFQKILLGMVTFILFCFLLVIIFGDDGFVELQQMRKQRGAMVLRNEAVREANRTLYRESDRLKNDPHYIENVARQELGMIGQDEMILKPQGQGPRHHPN